jgi:GT2 family glycosyltransferase
MVIVGGHEAAICGTGLWPRQSLTAAARQLVGDFLGWTPVATMLRPRRTSPSAAPFRAALCVSDPAAIVASPPPLVSVIILNRNGAAMLDALFESIHKVNRYPNTEIIIVDHASVDASPRVAAKWRDILNLTVVHCASNHPFAYSCNRAAERATGEYLMLLNNDVLLAEDIIGPMVATACRYGGMVGCRLLIPSTSRKPAEVQHIGVRFAWHRRTGLASPRDARPQHGDDDLCRLPSRFLGVTAAVCLCRRADYLAIGGFCEDYIYDYEDVDLCLKLALGQGRSNISLNDRFAWHLSGATRTKKTSIAQRRKRLNDNAKVLSRRFGYAARRTLLPLLFSDDGSQWGRRANVRFAAEASCNATAALRQRLGERYGWNVDLATTADLRNVDLLIVTNPGYRPERARHRHPLMLRVAWAIEHGDAWAARDLTCYDQVIAASAGLAQQLTRAGIRAAVIDPAAPDAAARLFALLQDCLRTRHRIVIRYSAAGSDRAVAAGLATVLRQAGHCVRFTNSAERRDRDAFRDDVVILLPSAASDPPMPGKIVIACGNAAPGAKVDARVPAADPEGLAAAIREQVARLHAERMRGPCDTPLVPLPPFAGRAVAGWL